MFCFFRDVRTFPVATNLLNTPRNHLTSTALRYHLVKKVLSKKTDLYLQYVKEVKITTEEEFVSGGGEWGEDDEA